MSDFDQAVFFQEFKAAGMLLRALCKGRGPVVEMDVGFVRPGEVLASGAISDEYEIEYETAKHPRLAEADRVTVYTSELGERFVVRSAPVSLGDGYFSSAQLTKV